MCAIQSSYSTYLPPRVILSEKMVQEAHIMTLHSGVKLTMARIGQNYWIPWLGQLAKNVINYCHRCKKFHAATFQNPPPGNLLVDRTEGSYPFQVVGVNYTGPIGYRVSKKKERKGYLLRFACSLMTAVHMEVHTDQITHGFIKYLKQFIARQGRPMKFYSDNDQRFVRASKWLKNIMKDEKDDKT